MFGLRYFRERLYYEAEHHLVHGNEDSARVLGDMAWEWGAQEYAEDRGTFVARAVLQYLVRAEAGLARACLAAYTRTVEKESPEQVRETVEIAGEKTAVFQSDLANMATLVLASAERRALDVFNSVLALYKPVVTDDFMNSVSSLCYSTEQAVACHTVSQSQPLRPSRTV